MIRLEIPMFHINTAATVNHFVCQPSTDDSFECCYATASHFLFLAHFIFDPGRVRAVPSTAQACITYA